MFSLTGVELEELARHMGHELAVHRNFYRLQEDVIELAKVSKLLLAVEEGKAHQFNGLNIDDIVLEGRCHFAISNVRKKMKYIHPHPPHHTIWKLS